MHCRHCHSVMLRTRSESGPTSRQEWYQCSVCRRATLLSIAESLLSSGRALVGRAPSALWQLRI